MLPRALLAVSAALVLSGCRMRPTVNKGTISFVKVKVKTTSANGLGPVTFLQEVHAAEAGNPMAEGSYQKLDVNRMLGIERVFDRLVPVHTDDGGLADMWKLPSRFRKMVDMHAFGLMSTSDGDGCTATHVGHGVVITAGHCFLDRSPAIRTNFACDGATIQWGLLYQSGDSINSVPPAGTSQCLWVDAAEWTNARDYAIFHVSPEPPVSIQVDFSRPTRDSGLTIYSHPVRRPLEWSGECNLLGATSVGTQFAHRCSTEPGSSGAAVLRSDTEPFSVIGIHDGGYATTQTTIGYNYGTYIVETPLRRILNGQWPRASNEAVLRRSAPILAAAALANNPPVEASPPKRTRIRANTVTDSAATAPKVATTCALTDTTVKPSWCVAQCWEFNGGGKAQTSFSYFTSDEDCHTKALQYCQGLGRSYCGYNYNQ